MLEVLAIWELFAGTSIYVGPSMADDTGTYCMGRPSVGQDCMLNTGIKSNTGIRYEMLRMLCTVG